MQGKSHRYKTIVYSVVTSWIFLFYIKSFKVGFALYYASNRGDF